MGGGLIQLVALGSQDVYLTGNPQITFFKAIYKRYSNFAKECIEQPLDGSEPTNIDVRKQCILTRNADLVQEIYLKSSVTLNSPNDEFEPELLDATALIKSVEIQIGGTRIDKHYSQWLDIYNELFEKNHKIRESMTTILFDNPMGVNNRTSQTNNGDIYIPLRFWFNRNPGLALPIISLQYHDITIIFDLSIKNLRAQLFRSNTATLKSVVPLTSSTPTTGNVQAIFSNTKLLTNYIYLDTEERRNFAQLDHEYLIEQVQFTGTENKNKFIMTFNHPVKGLFWNIYKNDSSTDNSNQLNVNDFKLTLNGHDRFTSQSYDYFHLIQQYENNLGNDFTMHNKDRTWTFDCNRATVSHNTALYSFCLHPQDFQPSGTCNFSRIDTAELSYTGFKSSEHSLYLFALNYNVFKVIGGQGGLTYAN